MRSLLSETLRTVNSKDSLEEVVFKCQSTPLLTDACSKSIEFWKDTLIRLHGNVGRRMVLQRGDLTTGDQWFRFCEGLAEGRSFEYVMNLDGVVKPRYATSSKLNWHYDIDIDGVLPLRKTDGIWVEIESNEVGSSLGTYVFFGVNCVRNLALWIFSVWLSDSKLVLIGEPGDDPGNDDEDEDNENYNPWRNTNYKEPIYSALEKEIEKAMMESDQFPIEEGEGSIFLVQVKSFVF